MLPPGTHTPTVPSYKLFTCIRPHFHSDISPPRRNWARTVRQCSLTVRCNGLVVFHLLGPSLEDLFNFCGRKFSLKTVLMLADQLIRRLQYIHSKSVIHRDIKPESFLIGVGNHGNQVYVTDLGLATRRCDAQVKANTGRARNAQLIGTARYASVNGHSGVDK